MTLTIVIIILTVIASIAAFNDVQLKSKLMLIPDLMRRQGDYHRFITHGLVHADYMHLGINMFVLYSFGEIVEQYFGYLFGNSGNLLFIALYVLSIVLSSIPSFLKNRFNPSYASLGASGAVSAVVFASILLIPWPESGGIRFFFIPIDIPPIIFGLLYLMYSAYMARAARDNINHDAHFYGAVFGFLFPIALKPELFNWFLTQLKAAF
jgi:membrane associated rhomboid family serine protease